MNTQPPKKSLISEVIVLFDYKKYKGLQNNTPRLRQAVKEQIRMEFNLEEWKINSCVDKIIELYFSAR